MRNAVLAVMLFASASLSPSFAQGREKVAASQDPPRSSQESSGQPAHSSNEKDQTGNQKVDREEADPNNGRYARDGDLRGDHGADRGWKARPDDEQAQNRYDRFENRDWGKDDTYQLRRDWDREGEYRAGRHYDRGRYRVKMCLEYENGDEYCRYQ